jgi:hypothetical protein
LDSSGKFAVRSARGFHYYSVFVDRKDGEKVVICHVKKKLSAVCEKGWCLVKSACLSVLFRR